MFTLGSIPEEVIPLTAITGGLAFGIIATVTQAIRRTLTEKYREESRREIAAYVAEGTLSPADAERILSAGPTMANTIRMACGR
jgi:hypothetical protein